MIVILRHAGERWIIDLDTVEPQSEVVIDDTATADGETMIKDVDLDKLGSIIFNGNDGQHTIAVTTS